LKEQFFYLGKTFSWFEKITGFGYTNLNDETNHSMSTGIFLLSMTHISHQTQISSLVISIGFPATYHQLPLTKLTVLAIN